MSRKQIHNKTKLKNVWYVSDVPKSHMTLLNADLKRKSADNVTEKDT